VRDVVSVRYALLASLGEGAKHGAQLRAEIEATVGDGRPRNAAQVRTALRRLEHDGLVESSADGIESSADGTDGRRKSFLITLDGERELASWLRAPPDAAVVSLAELAAKIQLVLRAPGIDVHEVAQVHRRQLIQLMQQWTRIKQGNDGHDLRAALAVDAELFRLDSMIRWLDAAGGHLERAAARLSRPVPPASPRPRGRDAVPPDGPDRQRASRAVADHIRTSDADRERATRRLRDHYAEGRLTRDELDERITAALNARTFGDLRRVVADLPEPSSGPEQAQALQQAAASRTVLGRPGHPMLLLLTLALTGVLITAAGWPLRAVFAVVLELALLLYAVGLIATARRWRRMRGR
jgi:DNA-binding PadR family transcriptional regulator